MSFVENESDSRIISYEMRTVALIDILGFSDLVSRSTQNAAFLSKLYHALGIVEHQGRVWVAQAFTKPADSPEEKKAKIDAMDFRSHAFSDCIVLSQRGTFVVPLFISVAQLMMALMDLGVLVRGGISFGPLYHDTSVVFGPALIEAYQLENRCAKFPRILVSEPVFIASQEGIVFFADQGSHAVYRPCEFLRRDSDRLYHLDCLTTALISPSAVIGADNAELKVRLERIAELVREEFQQNPGAIDTRAKWGWFLEYFNDFVRIRTSHLSELAVSPIGCEDDAMDPVVTWDRLRGDYFRRGSKDPED